MTKLGTVRVLNIRVDESKRRSAGESKTGPRRTTVGSEGYGKVLTANFSQPQTFTLHIFSNIKIHTMRRNADDNA